MVTSSTVFYWRPLERLRTLQELRHAQHALVNRDTRARHVVGETVWLTQLQPCLSIHQCVPRATITLMYVRARSESGLESYQTLHMYDGCILAEMRGDVFEWNPNTAYVLRAFFCLFMDYQMHPLMHSPHSVQHGGRVEIIANDQG